MCVCVCVCVRACVRARARSFVRACVRACVSACTHAEVCFDIILVLCFATGHVLQFGGEIAHKKYTRANLTTLISPTHPGHFCPVVTSAAR